MLLDSNAVIYAIKPEFTHLRELIIEHNPSVSAITYLEVLGYHQLTSEDESDFKKFFQVTSIIPISQSILEQAVNLRQERKMSLGDALIAATALLGNLVLVTANSRDFQWITNIRLINPLPTSNRNT